MNIIESIEVRRFRGGEKPLVLQLDPGVNFLIGRNGTGKTTLINLINAVLSVDAQSLASSDYAQITIKLKQTGSRSRPSITVSKTEVPSTVQYQIRGSASAKPDIYLISNSEVERSRHGYWPNLRYVDQNPDTVMVQRRIRSLVHNSWLSVHRSKPTSPEYPSSEIETTVDRKVTQIANDFSKYFSTLDKSAADETEGFQQNYFLSFLHTGERTQLQAAQKLDYEEEKAALQSIFTQFKMKPARYNAKLESHFKSLRKAVQRFSNRKGALDLEDLMIMRDTMRIHTIVQEWHKLIEKHREIYEPKDTFTDIISDLFYDKIVKISNSNQPVFISTESKNEIPVLGLSSGEKQLFILLGETLLQRKLPCVFLADEPELSLHVDWQVSLVPNLRRINPHAQVLFATHSPDIVGAYQKNTIDMETVL